MSFVAKVAKLARIEVPEEEYDALTLELSSILDFVRQLESVDTTQVAPMTSVIGMNLRSRGDVVTEVNSAGDILKNAPQSRGTYFIVPKVID